MAKFPRAAKNQAPNISDVWTQVQRTAAEIHRQAIIMRERIVSGTHDGRARLIDASALLDGLWDGSNGFPAWKGQLTRFEVTLRSTAFRAYARDQRMDATLDPGAALDDLLPAMDAVVDWIGKFFDTASGQEPQGTVEYIGGVRHTKKWPASDPVLMPLVPLLDAVLAAIE